MVPGDNFDIIIVGGGAAGLTAAVESSKAGKKVAVFEAQNRIGGRIHTLTPDGFGSPMEAGAEFVHGDLPVTLKMLKHYQIPLQPTGGDMWRARDGQLTPDAWDNVPGFDELFERLHKIKTDTSVQKFLEENFSDAKYQQMDASIRGFVEGFDTGDISAASILKFRDEWTAIEEEGQYRVEGGYGRLMDALNDDLKKHSGVVFLSSPVKTINWKRNHVLVNIHGIDYTAAKILITVPLGILQADAAAEGYINFVPPVTEKIGAAKKMGYGEIIKAVFRFSDNFWERFGFRKNNIGFIFSDAPVPTFWTQMPDAKPHLTAWIGGPRARAWEFVEDEQILKVITSSLAATFGINEDELKKELLAWHISNWTTEPYTLGSYSFATVGDKEVIEILKQPVEETIYFAGEALYEGDANGTVEAALSNGLEMAQVILANEA